MYQKHLLAFALFCASLTIAAPAHPQTLMSYSCPGINADAKERRRHVDLLEYAALAEAAYKDLGETTVSLQSICPMGISEQVQDTLIHIHRIPENILNKVAGEFRENNSNWKLDDYSDDTGEKFFTCTSTKTTAERLYVAFRYVLNNEGLSFFIKAAIVGIAGLTAKQEIGVVRLKNSKGETTIGVQGTDISSIDQWNTSVQNLIESRDAERSCLFPFVEDVVTHFFGKEFAGEYLEFRGKSKYSIVGHSLGGAVVQHVAKGNDLEGVVRGHHKDATFKAYSYNSIGVASGAELTGYQHNIVSVRVAGEILEQLERNVGRSQIGHIVRYGIPLGRTTEESGIRLHKIKSVKEKICNCLTHDRHMFEYGYR